MSMTWVSSTTYSYVQYTCLLHSFPVCSISGKNGSQLLLFILLDALHFLISEGGGTSKSENFPTTEKRLHEI